MSGFSVAAVFSNHMVLQREKKISIFGTAENGKQVCAEFLGKKYSCKAKNGRWEIMLDPQKAAEDVSLTITCGDEAKTFSDIAIGEVWLAGGQSNMELEIHTALGGEDMLKNDITPNVRFYYTQKRAVMNEEFYEAERNTGWSRFSTESARAWSAVGYLFAKQLADKLGVTVGVIGCNWGGTSASAWMSREYILEDADTRSYVDEYEKAIEGKSEEQQAKEYAEYEEYDREWNEKAAVIWAKEPNKGWDELGKIIGPNKWPGPMCCVNPFRPAGLYECMLKRVMPYTLRGFIYYQGESDDHKPNMYYKLFTKMIQQWRNDWRDDKLPFLFVQLPMHRYAADPDYKHWCLIREAQQKTFDTIKNTGMAVIIDAGEFNEIHPKDKRPVGDRLCRQALSLVYNQMDAEAANGPLYNSMVVDGDKINVFFDYAESGFTVKEKLVGFEIAGEDKRFVTATAVINADNSITVSADEVKEPEYVRYLWTNYGDVTLFGKNGIPVAPFRTSRDDQENVQQATVTIQQVMEL